MDLELPVVVAESDVVRNSADGAVVGTVAVGPPAALAVLSAVVPLAVIAVLGVIGIPGATAVLGAVGAVRVVVGAASGVIDAPEW